jgi:hypothetical protein
MKSIKEWFEGVQNDEMRKRLLELMQQDTWGDLNVTRLTTAICNGFNWGRSKEGFDYWDNMVSVLEEFGL